MPGNSPDDRELEAELMHVKVDDAERRIRRAYRLILEAADRSDEPLSKDAEELNSDPEPGPDGT